MPRGINDYDRARLQCNNRYRDLVNGQIIPNGAERNVLLAGNRIINEPSDIITRGLVLYLDAGIGASYPRAGTAWFDLSGNRNNGTLVNGPTFNLANGGSIVFDGVNDFVSGSIPTISNWSVAIWVRSTDITSALVFYPFSGTAGQNGLGFGGTLDSSTINRWYFFDGTTVLSNANTAVTTNIWYYLVVTKTSTTYNLYTNGSLSLNTTGVNLSLTQYSLARRGDNLLFYKGNIGQCSIYNLTLTADEVLRNFNAQRTRFGV